MEYLNGQDCSLLLTATGEFSLGHQIVKGQERGGIIDRLQMHVRCSEPSPLLYGAGPFTLPWEFAAWEAPERSLRLAGLNNLTVLS